ncbi:MAG: virulence RhuM family protein [Dysgonamonadaceae bacterium]|nr:virulence RhuM family protein [Dysgonamonadaceae bacterium]
MAEIFDTTKQNIGQHVRNILEEGELVRNSVVKFFFTTAADGKKYNTEHYNLDMIISLGYRVNSKVATLFRIWATEKLHGFLTLNERTILMDAGKISHELAKQHAEKEYEIFRVKQAQIPYNTDFEKFIDQIEP